MLDVIADGKREDLFREICDAYHRWPELDRRIFLEAHYHGRSPESISRFFKLDVSKVHTILSHCDRELHTSLREFFEAQ